MNVNIALSKLTNLSFRLLCGGVSVPAARCLQNQNHISFVYPSASHFAFQCQPFPAFAFGRAVRWSVTLSARHTHSHSATSSSRSPFLHRVSVSPFTNIESPLLTGQQSRWYFRKKTVKVPPTKPLNFDYAGDANTSELPLDMSQPRLGFEDSEELLDADDVVKKLYSLEFTTGRGHVLKRREELQQLIKTHPAEIQSLEMKIAILTALVKNQVKHCLEFRKDKVGKSQLVERIQRRRKYLKRLRKLDIEKYQWLLDRLQIKHVPTPAKMRKPYKREIREAAVRDRATAIRENAVAELRKRLDAERMDFMKHKQEVMSSIARDAEILGADMTLPLPEALAAIGVEIPVSRKERTVRRRSLLLQKKFEMYAHRAKLPDKFIV